MITFASFARAFAVFAVKSFYRKIREAAAKFAKYILEHPPLALLPTKKGRSRQGTACWRSPPGRRENLVRTARATWGRLLRLCAAAVRHQLNVDAAIGGAAVTGMIVLHRLILAQSN